MTNSLRLLGFLSLVALGFGSGALLVSFATYDVQVIPVFGDGSVSNEAVALRAQLITMREANNNINQMIGSMMEVGFTIFLGLLAYSWFSSTIAHDRERAILRDEILTGVKKDLNSHLSESMKKLAGGLEQTISKSLSDLNEELLRTKYSLLETQLEISKKDGFYLGSAFMWARRMLEVGHRLWGADIYTPQAVTEMRNLIVAGGYRPDGDDISAVRSAASHVIRSSPEHKDIVESLIQLMVEKQE